MGHRYRTGLSALFALSLLAGCPAPSSNTSASVSGSTPGTPAQTRINPAGSPAPAAAGSLEGTLQAPPAGAIAGASLVHDGGVILFRLLDLGESPVAGAQVSLYDTTGAALGDETVTTDQAGHFAFERVPATADPFFVHAEFKANGETIAFENVAGYDPKGAHADLDAATTLAAGKTAVLIQHGKLTKKKLAALKLDQLAATLRTVLAPETLPDMAKGSADLVPAFDQLVLDTPALHDSAASLSSDLVAQSGGYTVSTAFDATALQAKGVLKQARSIATESGYFEADQAGNLYLATNDTPARVMRIHPDGTVESFAKLPIGMHGPFMLTFAPDGSLYEVGVSAGTLAVARSGPDGTTTRLPVDLSAVAQNVGPGGLSGRLAVSADGTLYLAAPALHVIFKVPAQGGNASVFAGLLGQPGYVDGAAAASRFNGPNSLAIAPDGTLYVADRGNHCIRRIGTDGTVSTAAGSPSAQGYRSGKAHYAGFGAPSAMAVDAAGNLFVLDAAHGRIRRISPLGSVFLVAGDGTSGQKDGPGPQASFYQPEHLVIDGAGTLYTRDVRLGADGKTTELIRKITKNTP